VFYNVAGGIGWIGICTLLGYFLGTVPAVKDNMEKAIMLIVFLSIAPIFVHWVLERVKGAKPVEAVVETVAPGVDVE
jgi:membrane-associated protein